MTDLFEQMGIYSQGESIENPYEFEPFDPEGTGYDYRTAIDAGIYPDETGHWPSRVPDSGRILKGRGHETFYLTEQGEKEAGMEISKGEDGYYYSQPPQPVETPQAAAPDIFEQMGFYDTQEAQPMQPPEYGYGTAEESEMGLVMEGRPKDWRDTTFAGAAEALGRGAAEGLTVELPSMAGQALEFFTDRGQKELEELYRGVYNPNNEESRKYYQRLQEEGRKPNIGKVLSDWAERKRKEWYGPRPNMTEIEKMIYEGSKMLAPSIIPSGALNIGFRLVSGVGTTLKAARAAETAVQFAALMREANAAARASAAVASMGTAMIFGGAQAQQTLETALERATQLEAEGKYAEAADMRRMADIAPFITGGIEAVGEYFGTKYLGKLFGVTEAEVIKRTAKQLVIDFLKTLGVEVLTEFGQQLGQATTEKYTAIRPEAEPLAEALQVIGPTIVMTLLTGGGAGAYNLMTRKEKTVSPEGKEAPKGEPKIAGPVVPLPEQKATVGEEYGGLPTAGTMYGLTEESKIVEEGQKAEEAKTVGETRQQMAVELVDKMFGDLNQQDLMYVYDQLPKSAAAVKAEIDRRIKGGEKPQGPVSAAAEGKAPSAEEEVEVALPEGQGGQLEEAAATFKKLNPDFDETKWREAKPTAKIEPYYRLVAALGKKATFYEADEGSGVERVNGFYSHETDRIFINAKKDPVMFIMGHEIFHELKANHPDLHAAAMKVIKDNATTFTDYMGMINEDRKAAGMPVIKDPEKVWDEYASDLSGHLFEKPKFWMELNESHPDLFKQLADVVKKVIETIKNAIKQGGKRHNLPAEGLKNLEAVESAITEAYKQMLKRTGKTVAEGRTETTAETLAKMPRAGKVKITAIHAETGQRIKIEEDAKTAIDELETKIEKCYQVLECIDANS